jgi:hypothetical protein
VLPATPQTSHADIFKTEGDELTQNEDYNGAVVLYNKALKYAPSDITLLLSRSLAFSLSNPPRLDLALQDTDAVIQLSPTHWQGWQQKGEILQRMGDFQGADEALVNAVGFADGVDKLTARRLLVDFRARRNQPPAVTEPPTEVPTLSPNLPIGAASSTPPAVPSDTPSVSPTSVPTPSLSQPSGELRPPENIVAPEPTLNAHR